MVAPKSGFRALLFIGLTVFLTRGSHPARAQILHPPADRPSFEVATIKPWAPPPMPPPSSDGINPLQKIMKFAPVGITGQSTDRVHIILPAALLIASAYNIPIGSESRRILGPDWLHQHDQYEIQARIDDALFAAMQKMTPAQQHEQVQLMEQSLLEDRFKLKLHFETRDMPVYELTIAKGGPKLALAKDDERSKISTRSTEQGSELVATAVTLDDFARSPLLTGPAGARPVIDQTDLKGAYDFTLKWSSELTAPGNDAPSLFTAIQEQLGLRLVPSTAPVEVIVVDQIEHPSAN
jgi:bla regulator protein blaR1